MSRVTTPNPTVCDSYEPQAIEMILQKPEFKDSGKWNRNVPIHPELVPVNISSQPITQPNFTDESVSVPAEHLNAEGGNSGLNYSVCGSSGDESNDRSKPSFIYKRRRSLLTPAVTVETHARSSSAAVDGHTEEVPVITQQASPLPPPLSGTTSTTGDASQGSQSLTSRYNEILQSLPTDYMMVLDVVQDHLNDDQICEVLTSPDHITANTKILDCLKDMEVLKFCEVLEHISPLLSNPTNLLTIIGEIRAGVTSPSSGNVDDSEFPPNLIQNEDFAQLKAHYHAILSVMPDAYELTIGKLQNFIEDNEICEILCSSSSTEANKKILNCLIARMRHKEELLGLCDQLELISQSPDMMMIINAIKAGVRESLALSRSSMTTGQPVSGTNVSSTANDDHSTPTSSSATTESLNEATRPQHKQTRAQLEEKLKYDQRRLQGGFKYMQPPPKPSNCIDRQNLLDEVVTKLCQAANNPSEYGATLTISGAGGFGKTTTAVSLCYHPAVKEQFTDGFVFVELGPQATDPSIKLSRLYHLLTGKNIGQGDINHAEQEIKQLTSIYHCNLLVIIDDVWNVEDVEPLIRAFSSCKIVLTTRMKKIDQYIATTESVTIGPMIKSEAISLLTNNVIDSGQLPQEDILLLEELAEDVHLWPLLLSLIRGQLFHGMKHRRLSFHNAIENLKSRLHQKGLTAFDKNVMESVNKSRKLAVRACIETSLELLTKSLSDKLKTFILWTGIGTTLVSSVLHRLWNISEQEAEETVEIFWAYGLIQYTHSTLSSNTSSNHMHHVEVHTVISQYINDSIESKEAFLLSPYSKLNIVQSVKHGLTMDYRRSQGVGDPLELSCAEYLKYTLSELETVVLPYYLKSITMQTTTDPHNVILILQQVQNALMSSPYTMNMLSIVGAESNSLIEECKCVLKDTYKLCRKLNQELERIFYTQKYTEVTEVIKKFMKNYPMCSIAQKAVALVQKILMYCDSRHFKIWCEQLQLSAPGYHRIIALMLPQIKVHLKTHRKISSALISGLSDIDRTYAYLTAGQYGEDMKLVDTNYLIKLQEVAPMFVSQRIAQQ